MRKEKFSFPYKYDDALSNVREFLVSAGHNNHCHYERFDDKPCNCGLEEARIEMIAFDKTQSPHYFNT